MAKLRKMLGSIDNQYIISLRGLIETQSKSTLANWAIDYAENHFICIYEKAHDGNDLRLRNVVAAAKEYLNGAKKLNEVKPLLKEASQIAKEAEGNPIAQAAARAVAVACATIQTPTNALGFVFYGAAAVVYEEVGLLENSQTYDDLASEEFEKILKSLQEVAIPNEEKPAKINWNC